MGLEDFSKDSYPPPNGGSQTGEPVPYDVMEFAESGGTASKKKDQNNEDWEQWSIIGSNRFQAVGPTRKKLPEGMYTYNFTPQGLYFVQRPINVDQLLRFPDSLSEKLLNEISEFWTKGKVFKKHGFLHRRGYLLYGPQGSGKSCLVQLIVADIISRGGLVMLCSGNPSCVDTVLQVFRVVEDNRPLVCLFEDIDSIVKTYGESDLLALLDGENQINTVINLATTNFPELLPRRIVSRPRRFDRIIKIGFPDAKMRRIYFEKKLNIEATEIDKWVKVSEGWSFAACAELVISVKCLSNDWDETVEKLNDIGDAKFSSNEFNRGLTGFGELKK